MGCRNNKKTNYVYLRRTDGMGRFVSIDNTPYTTGAHGELRRMSPKPLKKKERRKVQRVTRQ
jgi:hypothetical protein